MRLFLERMQYMYSVSPTDHVEDPERAALILNPDFPDATADARERSAMQRLVAQLQQLEFAANADAN